MVRMMRIHVSILAGCCGEYTCVSSFHIEMTLVKAMSSNPVGYKKLKQRIPVGYKEIICFNIFDI